MVIFIEIMTNILLKVLSLNQTGIFEKKLVEQSDIATNLEEKKEKLDDKRKELESRLNDTNIALKTLEDEITAQKKKIDSFESMFENIFKHHENATQVSNGNLKFFKHYSDFKKCYNYVFDDFPSELPTKRATKRW